ncbi:hypothetical protein Aperf_G00000098102 [Anoplocephala perfoliata]
MIRIELVFDTEALPKQAALEAPGMGTLRLQCPLCTFHTTSSIVLRRHAWTQHLSSESGSTTFQSRIIVCCQCGAATTDPSSLRDHHTFVHGINDPGTPVSSIFGVVDTFGIRRGLKGVKVQIRWITLSRGAVTGTMSVNKPNPIASRASVPPAVTTPSPEDGDDEDEGPLEEPSTSDFSPPLIETIRAEASSPPTIPTSTLVPISTVPESQDWSQLISRVEKKFSCLLCAASSPSVYYYNGRTEVVFHVVTRHLLRKEIEDDLAHHMKLTNPIKQRIGILFVDGMHIRSGVHYKDAERVEAALFRSVELHLRWKALPEVDSSSPPQNVFTCSGCHSVFHNEQIAVSHINQELRSQLPDFMRARSCPWSLSTRDEWVWCVPDLQISPVAPLHPPSLHLTLGSSPPRDPFSATTLSTDTPTGSGAPRSLLFAGISSTSSSAAARRL